MKRFFILPVLAIAMGGCFSSRPPAARNWVVEWNRSAVGGGGEARKYGVARLASVSVRAPYDTTRIAVLRPDGTIAFDAYNLFAVAPSLVVRGAAEDTLAASGMFERVIPASSQASASVAVEVVVTAIALDCRNDGKRDAFVALTATLLDGRRIVASSSQEGRAATSSGDFSAAFSRAFVQALSRAAREL